jgi:hypothetical protein
MRGPAALAVLAVGFLAPATADAFAPGQVYWTPGGCSPPCGLFDVTDGGDQQAASPFAVIERAPGQLAWVSDLATAYITQYDSDTIASISASGSTTAFATGIDGATGLLFTQDDRLLAASYRSCAVYDATAGGDLSEAVPFASGFGGPRNLLQLATDEILLADQVGRAIFDISDGGDFSAATPFASGFAFGPMDLVQDGEGRVFASTQGGVFEITGGGDFSSTTPHATGRMFIGLAAVTVDTSERLLASDFDSGDVFDITDGGDFSATVPFASNLPGYGDTALDTVPGGSSPPPPLAVPSLRGAPTALLAVLLAAIAAACHPRPAGAGTRQLQPDIRRKTIRY